MKILVVCTGNRCRSQMAHGILQSLDPTITVRSAEHVQHQKFILLALRCEGGSGRSTAKLTILFQITSITVVKMFENGYKKFTAIKKSMKKF